MIKHPIRCGLTAAAALFLVSAAPIGLGALPAFGQAIVYDPSNYAQNVLQAARALEQINHQVTGLQNQTQMLLNQARNLASLPHSSLQTIQQSLARTQQLLNQAQRLAYDVNEIDRTFQRLYPQSYSSSTSSQQLLSDAKERWQNSHAAFQDSLRVQAGVVQALDATRNETETLVWASQSAVGALQAAQAGNQLSALQIKQLADLTALIAAQARAENLAGARSAANQEQVRAQLGRFLTGGRGYQAQPVQMFR
jgi:P-type conjugative transfer protein TrbJ